MNIVGGGQNTRVTMPHTRPTDSSNTNLGIPSPMKHQTLQNHRLSTVPSPIPDHSHHAASSRHSAAPAHRIRSTCCRRDCVCPISWVASPLAMTSFSLDSQRKAQRARSLGRSPKAVSATFLRKAKAAGPMRPVVVMTKGTMELMLSFVADSLVLASERW